MALIDDAVEFIIPALQPHEGHFPALWGAPDRPQRATYAGTLAASLAGWFSGQGIGTRLMACSPDLSVLRLRLRLGDDSDYEEDENGEPTAMLGKLHEHINQPIDGNFQVMPDLRVFAGESLYLIKPMQLRFWLRSTALADADEVALELQQLKEPLDLPLDGSCAPGLDQGRQHRIPITVNTAHKGVQLRSPSRWPAKP